MVEQDSIGEVAVKSEEMRNNFSYSVRKQRNKIVSLKMQMDAADKEMDAVILDASNLRVEWMKSEHDWTVTSGEVSPKLTLSGWYSPYTKQLKNGKRFDQAVSDIVLKSVNLKMRSTTKVVLEGEYAKGTMSYFGWYGVIGRPSVVVGNFGFGIRVNKASRKLKNLQEFKYVLMNSDMVCKNLRRLKLENMAKLLEDMKLLLPEFGSEAHSALRYDLQQDERFEVFSNITSNNRVASGFAEAIVVDGSQLLVEAKFTGIDKVYKIDLSPSRNVCAWMSFLNAEASGIFPKFAQFVELKKKELDKVDIDKAVDELTSLFKRQLLVTSL